MFKLPSKFSKIKKFHRTCTNLTHLTQLTRLKKLNKSTTLRKKSSRLTCTEKANQFQPLNKSNWCTTSATTSRPKTIKTTYKYHHWTGFYFRLPRPFYRYYSPLRYYPGSNPTPPKHHQHYIWPTQPKKKITSKSSRISVSLGSISEKRWCKAIKWTKVWFKWECSPNSTTSLKWAAYKCAITWYNSRTIFLTIDSKDTGNSFATK